MKTETKETTMPGIIDKPKTWTPVIGVSSGETPCGLCGVEIEPPQTIRVAMKATGERVCQSCTESIGAPGEAIWMLADALEQIDSAIYWTPEHLRAGAIGAARDVIAKIGEVRVSAPAREAALPCYGCGKKAEACSWIQSPVNGPGDCCSACKHN